jgi:uncharacterized protein YkwD
MLALTMLGIVAVVAWVPFYLGKAGDNTLETANGSPVALQDQQSAPVNAASTVPGSTNSGEASRSQRREPITGASVPASPSARTSATPSAAASPTTSGTPTATLESAAPGSGAETAKVVELVNAARADAGCGPVHTDPRLDAAALAHSQDMIARDYFSHTTPDGISPWDRARAAGYDVPTGENIALGQADAASVMDAWMTSEGHRANILNCASRAIGTGLAIDTSGTPYWTQMFGAE